jgi:hypothetical protein
MSNSNYQKYLKYKLKYLELKNELEGDNNQLEGGNYEYEEYNELEGGDTIEIRDINELKQIQKEITEQVTEVKTSFNKLELENTDLKKELKKVREDYDKIFAKNIHLKDQLQYQQQAAQNRPAPAPAVQVASQQAAQNRPAQQDPQGQRGQNQPAAPRRSDNERLNELLNLSKFVELTPEERAELESYN